jgi:hypothetical protein
MELIRNSMSRLVIGFSLFFLLASAYAIWSAALGSELWNIFFLILFFFVADLFLANEFYFRARPLSYLLLGAGSLSSLLLLFGILNLLLE